MPRPRYLRAHSSTGIFHGRRRWHHRQGCNDGTYGEVRAMENSPMDKYVAGFGMSLAVTSVLNAIILIIKEKNDAVMSAMKAALGHHWTTHGAIVIIVFFVLGFIFSAMRLETKFDSHRTLK